MRRWWAAALLVLAACGGGDDGPSGRAGPDDPSATTVATTSTTTTTTAAPTATEPAVAPGPLAGRLNTQWLTGRVRASGGRAVTAVPGTVPPEVAIVFTSADAHERFRVVAGPTAQVGPPVLGPVSGLGSTDQIGDVQVRVYSGDDPGAPGTNLELAAFRCRDLSVRLIGRDLDGLGEVVSVAGRFINAMGCNEA